MGCRYHRMLASVCVCLLLAGCSSGLSMSDYESLSVGMTVEEAEAVIGSEMVVAGEETLMGQTLAVGYFGDEDGPRITVVSLGGEITRLEPVGLD